MQATGNVSRVSTRPLVLLVALLSAVALALVAWHTIASQAPASPAGQTTFHMQSVGTEQIAHDRSEQDLGSTSAAGEQIAHNRSEEGLG